MFSFNQLIIIICIFGVFGLLYGIFGAWVTFKSKNALPGQGLIGGVPKGEVFTMKDDLDKLDEPDEAEKSILEKTEQFLKVLGVKT